MSVQELQTLVTRLEAVASKLEGVSVSGDGGAAAASAGAAQVVPPSVLAFDEIVSGPVAAFLGACSTIGGDVGKQGSEVSGAFAAQRQFLMVAANSKSPAPNVLQDLLKPTSARIEAIQTIKNSSRDNDVKNHLSAISESIGALAWVAISPAPGPYVKEMGDSGQFYLNRVLKDLKEVAEHKTFCQSWTRTLSELQGFIKQYHTTGVTWNPQGGDAASAAPASAPAAPAAGGPPPPPPPPVPVFEDDSSSTQTSGGVAQAALFADISRGTAVTTGLKKVTDDMKTHKNPGLREGPKPYKAPAASKPTLKPKPSPPTAPKQQKKPATTALVDKRWMVEHHEGNQNIVIDKTEMKQQVYIFKCTNSCVNVKGKVNSIILDNCKKVGVVFENVISSVEFINCQSVQAQVTGNCPTVSIEKTDGCMVYLSAESVTAEIITAKSSEMNILVPDGNGEFTEHAIPEQFKTVWNPAKKTLDTTMTESG